MNDWIFSFLLASILVAFFFFGEILRELELEDKAIKDGIKHLTSRCDYRIFLLTTYIATTIIMTLCIHKF